MKHTIRGWKYKQSVYDSYCKKTTIYSHGTLLPTRFNLDDDTEK